MFDYFRHKAYRFKYLHGKKLNLKKPVDIALELSSICNMSCAYCYHADPQNLPFKRANMKWPTIEKIIYDAAKLGVNSIKFNWKGEGTLNPNYYQATELAKDLAKGSTFIDRIANTNFRIHPSRREMVFLGLCNLTKVKISYDSFKKEVFEKQRSGGNFDLTTENIDLFYNHEVRKASKTQIVIQAVRTKLNKNEDIVSKVGERWPDAIVSIRDMVEGRLDNKLDTYTHRSRNVSERESCLQAHVRLIFNQSGVAFPCCPDTGEQLALGNIANQSISEIFNSKRAKGLRKALKNGKAFQRKPCLKCSSFESYKGYKPGRES